LRAINKNLNTRMCSKK